MRREFTLTLVALALLALTACSVETEVTPPNPSQGNEISFGSVSTRVDSASEINEFSVWATVSSIGSNAVSYQPLLTNERVYRNPAGSNTWAYDNVQRWLPNSIFHFFAAYPYNIGFEQMRQEVNGTLYTAYWLNVTADGSADTEDILTAQNVTNTNNSYNTTVPLTFSHLLTKFNLKVSQNFDIDPDFNYYVTKVTIKGLSGSGTYMIMPYNDQFMERWNFDNASPLTIVKEYDTPQSLRDTNSTTPKVVLTVFGDGLMLLPQEIAADGVEIVVDYIYDVTVDDDYSDGTPKQARGFIPSTTWESSKSINYSITVSNKSNITFSQPTIEPWGAPQTGGTIIIK